MTAESSALAGKVALVTGGLQGIGRAVALDLARRGARVVVTSRSPERGAPDGVEVRRLDVRDEAAVTACVDEVARAFGRLDVLVNNAGVGVFKPMLDTSSDELRAVFETNVFGLWACATAAARQMKRSGGGRILNVGSIAACFAIPENGAYGASKWAVRGLTEVMNAEWHPYGIFATLISLGAVHTDIWEGREGFDPRDMLPLGAVAEAIGQVAATPAGVRIDEIKIFPPRGVL